MAKVTYLQSAFVSGVLDPRIAARTELRQYYQGMSVGTNVVVVPLGGVKRRPGLRYALTLPARMARVSTGITPTAPNGGTAANANDDDRATKLLTTTNISTTNPYVIVHYDLGSAKSIYLAEVRDLLVNAGDADSEVSIQSSIDNANWSAVNPVNFALGQATFEKVDADPRSYVRGSLLSPTVARYWRVARQSGGALPDLGTADFQLSGFNLYEATGPVSEVKLLAFERSATDLFMVAMLNRFAVVAKNGAVYDVAPTDYASADVPDLDAAQNQDAMVIVHEDHAPVRLVRESDFNWQIYETELFGVPQFDYNDADSPTPVSEVQTVTFSAFTEGDTFQLELEGARTGPIAYQPTSTATTAENIRRAVQALHTVGFTGVSVAFTAGTTYTVTFAEASADDYDLMTGTTLSGTGTVVVVAGANGTPRTEDVWSDERGWPTTVTFHEGRLWFGGTRSLPNAYFGSVVNDFFNFFTGEGLDDDAVFGVLNTAQLNAITALKSGRFLQLFTSGGEFRFTVSPITPADAPRNQTEYGTARIRPVSSDGATIYVQRTRKVIRDFLYRYEEDAYSSVPLSVLAQHLLNSITGIAAWQGSDSDDANYVFIVNGDGTIAVLNTLRSQEIAAFTLWTTDGEFKDVGVTGEDRYFAVLRELNSIDTLTLELADEDYYTDCAKVAVATGGNFTHLAGEDVRIRADGFVLTSVTVNGSGNIVIVDDYTPVSTIEAGLNWVPVVTTMPLSSDFGGSNFLRKKRVVNMRCYVYQSLGVRYNGRPLPDRFFDLDNFDEAPEPFTGVHSLEETSNWDEGPLTQTFDQVDPLPFHLLGIDLQVETS